MPRDRYSIRSNQQPPCARDHKFIGSPLGSILDQAGRRTSSSLSLVASVLFGPVSIPNERTMRMEDNQVHQQRISSEAVDDEIEFIPYADTPKLQAAYAPHRQQDGAKSFKHTEKWALSEKATSSPYATGRNTMDHKMADLPRVHRNAAAGPSSGPRHRPPSSQTTDEDRVNRMNRSRRPLISDDDRPPPVPSLVSSAGDDIKQWPYSAAGTIRGGLTQPQPKGESRSVGFGSHGKGPGINGVSRGRRATIRSTKTEGQSARTLGNGSQMASDPETEPMESIDTFSPPPARSRLFDVDTSSEQTHNYASLLQKPRRPMRKKDGTIPESRRANPGITGPMSSHIQSSFHEFATEIDEASLNGNPIRPRHFVVRHEVVALVSGTQTVELPYDRMSDVAVCCVPEHPCVILQVAIDAHKDWLTLSKWGPSRGGAATSKSKILLTFRPGQAAASALERFRMVTADHGQLCQDFMNCEKDRRRVSRSGHSAPQVITFDGDSASRSSPIASVVPEKRRTIDSGTARLPQPPKKSGAVKDGQQTLSFPSTNTIASRRSARRSSLNDGPSRTEPPPPMPENRNEELFVFPLDDPAGLSVTRGDRWRIEAHEFLNDTLIDFGLKHVIASLPPAVQERVHLFNSFFYEKLSSKGKNRRIDDSWPAYESVRKWTKGKNLFEKDYILVPINENFHWYLAIIFMPKRVLGQKEVSTDLRHDDQIPQRPITRSSVASGHPTDTPQEENIDAIPTDEARSVSSAAEADLVSERLLSGTRGSSAPSIEAADRRCSPSYKEADRHRSSSDPINLIDRESETEDFDTISEVNGDIQRRFEAVSVSSEAGQPEKGRPVITSVLTAMAAQQEASHSRPSKSPGPSPDKDLSKNRRDIIVGTAAWVMTFDSLGGSHRAVHSCLDAWLRFEARDKLASSEVDYANPSQYLEARVPLQPNSSDCGLYLVHFAHQMLRHTSTVLAFLESPVPKGSGAERKQWETSQNDAWNTADTGSMRSMWLGTIDSLTHAHRRNKMSIFRDSKTPGTPAISETLSLDAGPLLLDTPSFVPGSPSEQRQATAAAEATLSDATVAIRTPPISDTRALTLAQTPSETRVIPDTSSRRNSPQPFTTQLGLVDNLPPHVVACKDPAHAPLQSSPAAPESSGDHARQAHSQSHTGYNDMAALDSSLSAIEIDNEPHLAADTYDISSNSSSDTGHSDSEMRDDLPGAGHSPFTEEPRKIHPEDPPPGKTSSPDSAALPYTHIAPLDRVSNPPSINLSPFRSLGGRQQNGKSSPREASPGDGRMGDFRATLSPSGHSRPTHQSSPSAKTHLDVDQEMSHDESMGKIHPESPSPLADRLQAEKVKGLSRVLNSPQGFISPTFAARDSVGSRESKLSSSEIGHTKPEPSTPSDDLESVNSEAIHAGSSTSEPPEPIESEQTLSRDAVLPSVSPAMSTRPQINRSDPAKGRRGSRKRPAPKSKPSARGKKAKTSIGRQAGVDTTGKQAGRTRESAIDVDSDEGD